jgi:predicted enzyme related to lactoylglutathione lyase
MIPVLISQALTPQTRGITMLGSFQPFQRALLFAALVMASGIATAAETPAVAVSPQYDTTHVYIPPAQVNRFVASFIATFGGKSTKQFIATVTPTPSSTSTQLVFTPSGTLSVFGFRTPVPFPFGDERTGYLVTDMDQAVAAARASGAEVTVATFPDPIGRDAVIRWPGGVNMQLYWHTKAPSYDALKSVPENRVYVSPDAVQAFVDGFVRFSHGHVVSDDATAAGTEIGRPGSSYRRIRIASDFGKMVVLVTDGHLPYPYGYEMTGYQVDSVTQTLKRAKATGAQLVAGPYTADGREAAMLKFPGGYVAEIHASTTP